MKVKVKYFAVCREMFNRDEEEMELPDGAVLMDVLKRLEREWPEIPEYYEVMQMSVNWEYATEQTELSDGDEVALIPPVTGGIDV
ncbi:MAG: MoaD/ThiS family protein [Candidatus Poribacteria bacterium]|nr:MoaD/ThiS family protein [Candidatus Poribacteria bacterium]